MDRSPAEVVATLLDEEVYLCSERTMYRVLASEVPVQERRAQRTHPEYKKPELMATAPNQVWSWDITRLLGPKKWSYYYLYVIMDIYSRYVVGWMVADRENSALAGRLIQQSCLKHGVQPRVLTLHSDRGAPMTSQCTAQLLADLGVTRDFFAADAASGDVLWRFQTGGRVYANPITYMSEGRQFIAIAAGSGLFTFALPERP